jgi:hypothetical protein
MLLLCNQNCKETYKCSNSSQQLCRPSLRTARAVTTDVLKLHPSNTSDGELSDFMYYSHYDEHAESGALNSINEQIKEHAYSHGSNPTATAQSACPTTYHVLGDQTRGSGLQRHSHGSRYQPQMVEVVVAALRCLVVVVGLFLHSRMHIFLVHFPTIRYHKCNQRCRNQACWVYRTCIGGHGIMITHDSMNYFQMKNMINQLYASHEL